jgi:hypothetical protein
MAVRGAVVVRVRGAVVVRGTVVVDFDEISPESHA